MIYRLWFGNHSPEQLNYQLLPEIKSSSPGTYVHCYIFTEQLLQTFIILHGYVILNPDRFL